jgi:hypothetical protein
MMGNGIDGDEGVMNQTRALVPTPSTILVGTERIEYGSDFITPSERYDLLARIEEHPNDGKQNQWRRGRDKFGPYEKQSIHRNGYSYGHPIFRSIANKTF